jgi:DNA-binding NarL/FixJ family response regulator
MPSKKLSTQSMPTMRSKMDKTIGADVLSDIINHLNKAAESLTLEQAKEHINNARTTMINTLIKDTNIVVKHKNGFIDELIDESELNVLTPTERLVLVNLSVGATNKKIAQDLGLSLSTIKAHVHHIIRKLNTNNRTEAVLIYKSVQHKQQSVEETIN